MKRTIKRFLSTTSAIILGVIIILLLTFAGNKSNGPLEDLFIKISNQVINVENKIVMLKRRPVRKKHFLGLINIVKTSLYFLILTQFLQAYTTIIIKNLSII